jgi:hypothetical protein
MNDELVLSETAEMDVEIIKGLLIEAIDGKQFDMSWIRPKPLNQCERHDRFNEAILRIRMLAHRADSKKENTDDNA